MMDLADLFDGSTAVKPPLDEAALRAIPAKRGIFLLVAADGRPILLTTAADIRSRLRFRLSAPEEDDKRHKTADLREITASIHWRLTHSHFQTDWQFLEIARRIWPDSYARLLPRRMAWFVVPRVQDPAPHLAITSEPGGDERHFGPFAGRRSAEEFIDALADVFDLCRCISVLRKAPLGQACAYKQIGRCSAPCDGSGSMEDYRRLVAQAVEFAAGSRTAQREILTARMRQAAEARQFERAGVLKSRLERAAAFDGEKFAHVGDVTQFTFVIIQPGPSFHQACSFVCVRGQLAEGPILEFPPTNEAAAQVLEACDRLTGEDVADDLARRRMTLVASYMLNDPDRRGLILPREVVTVEELAARIIAAAEVLHLREKRKKAGGGRLEAGGTAGTTGS